MYLGIATGRRRRISPNPTAGDVRSREYRYGPWMERTNRRIEAENLKAEGVIFEKRVFDLAKQAVAALQGETIIDHCGFFVLKPKSVRLGRLAGQIATRCRQRWVLWLMFENSRVSRKKSLSVHHDLGIMSVFHPRIQ